MQEPDTQYRAIAFDCFGEQQEGVNRINWKRRPKYILDSEGRFDEVIGTLTSQKGQNIHSAQRTNLFGKSVKGTDLNGGGSSATSWHSWDRALWICQTLSCPRRVFP